MKEIQLLSLSISQTTLLGITNNLQSFSIQHIDYATHNSLATASRQITKGVKTIILLGENFLSDYQQIPSELQEFITIYKLQSVLLYQDLDFEQKKYASRSGFSLVHLGSDAIHLEIALQAAIQGGVYLCPPSQQLLKAIIYQPLELPDPDFSREKSLPRLLSKQLNYKQIGTITNLSPHTIKTRASSIYSSFGCEDRYAFIRRAANAGYCQVEQGVFSV